MPTATATGAELIEVRSHYLETEYPRGGEIAKEELYPRVRLTHRGKELGLELEASRYRHSGGGWSAWRVFVRRARAWSEDPTTYRSEVNLTATRRDAFNAAAVPLVLDWLESDAYARSRQRAAFYMLARKIRDEGTSADGPAEELARHRAELAPDDLERLELAVAGLRQMLENTDASAA